MSIIKWLTLKLYEWELKAELRDAVRRCEAWGIEGYRNMTPQQREWFDNAKAKGYGEWGPRWLKRTDHHIREDQYL